MTQTLEKHDVAPRIWYRETWVWFLIGIPVLSIILSFTMLSVAISGDDALVKDEYYKEGLAINESFKLDDRARELGLSAELVIENEHIIKVYLQGQQGAASGVLLLDLEHPTQASQDLQMPLAPSGNHFFGRLESPLSGKRYLTLTDQQLTWRLQSEAAFPRGSLLLEPTRQRAE